MSCPLATERVWLERSRYHDAEKDYFERLSKLLKDGNSSGINLESNNSNAVKLEAINSGPQLSSNQSSEIPLTGKPKKNKKSKARLSESSTSSQTDIGRDMNKCEFDKEKQNSGSVGGNEKVNSHPSNEESKTKKKKKNNKDFSEKNHENTGKKDKFDKQKSMLVLQEQQENHHECNAKIKSPGSGQCTLVSEIAKARQHIKNSLERMDGIAALAASPVPNNEVIERLSNLEKENAKLKETVESLRKLCLESQNKIKALESRLVGANSQQTAKKEPPKPAAAKPKNDSENDDDGVDLFASDEEEENEEATKIREQRLAEYNAKKAKKPVLIAKSSVLLDVKPWDDETDLKEMEKIIRKIETDGLLWGASKLVPVAFGIKKLVINCVVEDEKVSIDWLTEEIEKIEDYVQSVDVAAFNKI